MILVIGSARDSVLRALAHRFKALQTSVLFVDQDRLVTEWNVNEKGWSGLGRMVSHETIRVVYSRVTPAWALPHQQSLMNELLYLLDEEYPDVINRPRSTLSNAAKGYQLDFIKTTVFQKPDYAVYSRCYHRCDTQWIYKSMSGVRSIVSNVEKPNEWVEEPVLFQRLINGLNIRVHVLDGRVWARAIAADAIDYRYAKKRHMWSIALPRKITEECCNITKQLGLRMSGIDLIRKGYDFFLLEVNPQPGFPFFDPPHQPIAQGLMEALCQT